MAGEYRSGYAIDGVIQGDATAKYKPAIYVFNLLIDGVPQTSLTKTVKGFNGTGWDQETTAPSGTMATCSVTVTVNRLTNIDKSTDVKEENASTFSAAIATLTKAIAAADDAHTLARSVNFRSHEDALVSNRAVGKLLYQLRTKPFTLRWVSSHPK